MEAQQKNVSQILSRGFSISSRCSSDTTPGKRSIGISCARISGA